MKHFGYGEQDFIPDEIDGSRAVDIHHINGRGKGKDVIGNLMALSRENHTKAHNEILKESELQKIHDKYLQVINN